MEITTEFTTLWPTPADFKSDITAAQLFAMSAAEIVDSASTWSDKKKKSTLVTLVSRIL